MKAVIAVWSIFSSSQVFGRWDIVLGYDLSRGLRALAGDDAERLRSMSQYLVGRWGEPATWPRDPDKVLLGLDAFIERNLLEEPANRKSVAIIFDYAQFLVPTSDLDSLAQGRGRGFVRFLSWAQNPLIKRVNTAFVLIVDKLVELNERLVQSPHVATIEIPLPDLTEREKFVPVAAGGELSRIADFTATQLAKISNGLTITNLNVVLTQAARDKTRLDAAQFRQLKKSMIERQCQGLVEIIEPKHTLDLVVGLDAAKERLQQDAAWISEGQLDSAPMGYLICGPVGTGKTFLAECYAGSIGIPCLVLRNFRSKYVGETEGNLELVLGVLRSLGPVIVIVDEADAALGNRQASGDSGTSARVFSMIASQMGDTRFRGQIIWMLLTSRPDLLPIDLKRQGRAEVHIPLFYPTKAEDIIADAADDGKEEQGAACRRCDSGRRSGPTAIGRRLGKHRHRRPPRGTRRQARHRRPRRSGTGPYRIHSVCPRTGKGTAGTGRRARMYAAQLSARRVAGENRAARRSIATAGTNGRHPPTLGRGRLDKCISLTDGSPFSRDAKQSAEREFIPQMRNLFLSKPKEQPMATTTKSSWFDESTNASLIADQAQRLDSFIANNGRWQSDRRRSQSTRRASREAHERD